MFQWELVNSIEILYSSSKFFPVLVFSFLDLYIVYFRENKIKNNCKIICLKREQKLWEKILITIFCFHLEDDYNSWNFYFRNRIVSREWQMLKVPPC